MTTKEYIKKYELNVNNKFNHNEFVDDMKSELIILLELNKANDNIKGFDNAVRCIKMKWDAVANKTLGIFPEKLWNFFFATVVVKLKNELCGREMQKRKESYEHRKANRDRQNEFFDNEFKSDFWQRIWIANLLADIKKVPAEAFIVLCIKNIENIAIADVQSAYRALALKHHPDKGGKQEDFIKITEAKNKCIAWLN
jgi:hypothetical protein